MATYNKLVRTENMWSRTNLRRPSRHKQPKECSTRAEFWHVAIASELTWGMFRVFYYVLDVWNLTFYLYDFTMNGFYTSPSQSFYKAAIFKVHKSLGVRMLGGHVVLDFCPCIQLFPNWTALHTLIQHCVTFWIFSHLENCYWRAQCQQKYLIFFPDLPCHQRKGWLDEESFVLLDMAF